MQIRNFFKPKWQHPKETVRLAAIAKISCPKTLREIASRSKDERLRLEAARRLADTSLLSHLARSAAQDTVRFEAALLLRDQVLVAAIALNDWNINRGKLAVRAIDNDLLLHRIARSAQQDAIRLTAAMKLNRPELLRDVAETTQDIHIRWRIARHLDDPYLMAEIALYKPANDRLEPIRRQAFDAYTAHLEQCRKKGQHQVLMAIFHTVAHTPYKIEAFVRLPADYIDNARLKYLSRQDFRYTPEPYLDRMFETIEAAGWRTTMVPTLASCSCCTGRSGSALKRINRNGTGTSHHRSLCTECNGQGQIPVRVVTCRHNSNPNVVFEMSAPLVDGYPAPVETMLNR